MKNKFRARIGLTLTFTLVIMLVLIVTFLITGSIGYLWFQSGRSASLEQRGPFPILLVFLVSSFLVGILVSFPLGHFPLKPLRKVISAINQLAKGDFSVRLTPTRPMPAEFRALSDSFNRMAQELGGIEMLRSDFVNDFSHEFKTPIVSIKGYAEMLKYDDLSPADRNQYLDIIIQESARLASLSTHVLNLSKVEAQAILTDLHPFNLSEQIRRSILLLEPKWGGKNLSFDVDVDDVQMDGNEEMLQQVWINLLDNAIKFTPEDGCVSVSLRGEDGRIHCRIKDSGEGIAPEALDHIFDKFYQADSSHATAGNGLGLALAQRIVTLHNGTISCESHVGGGTTFDVWLPFSAREGA